MIKVCLFMDKLSSYNPNIKDNVPYEKHLNFFCELFCEEIIFAFNYDKFPSTCDFQGIAKNVDKLILIKPYWEVQEALKLFIISLKSDIIKYAGLDAINDVEGHFLEILGIKNDHIINNYNGYENLAKYYLLRKEYFQF